MIYTCRQPYRDEKTFEPFPRFVQRKRHTTQPQLRISFFKGEITTIGNQNTHYYLGKKKENYYIVDSTCPQTSMLVTIMSTIGLRIRAIRTYKLFVSRTTWAPTTNTHRHLTTRLTLDYMQLKWKACLPWQSVQHQHKGTHYWD